MLACIRKKINTFCRLWDKKEENFFVQNFIRLYDTKKLKYNDCDAKRPTANRRSLLLIFHFLILSIPDPTKKNNNDNPLPKIVNYIYFTRISYNITELIRYGASDCRITSAYCCNITVVVNSCNSGI